jgi:hypothetical protein
VSSASAVRRGAGGGGYQAAFPAPRAGCPRWAIQKYVSADRRSDNECCGVVSLGELRHMSDLSRASHWRKRAVELRAIITRLHAGEDREPLLALADDLDRMAERLERREKSKG